MIGEYFIGFDPAQAQDWSAICGLQHEKGSTRWDCTDLFRFPKGTSYVDQVRHIVAMVDGLREAHGVEPIVVVDGTGCGAPVVDLFRDAGQSIAKIIVVSGLHSKFDRATNCWHLLKLDLIAALVIALQQHEFHLAPELELAPVLMKEMASYRVKHNEQTGYETFGPAYRDDSTNDDLVLAAAMAMWLSKKVPIMGLREYLRRQEGRRKYFDDPRTR